MAQQASFDITSTVDLQEVDNAVNQAIIIPLHFGHSIDPSQGGYVHSWWQT